MPLLAHQIILHPDIPYRARRSFTPYERKVGFSWYQQALKLLGKCNDILDATDVLEQLNDTPIGGRTFAPAEGLQGLLLELADDFRHYIETTPWWKLQWHLWTRKRPWLASQLTGN